MVASFFIRQFLRRQGSARRSLATTLQRECITNEITVGCMSPSARSRFIIAQAFAPQTVVQDSQGTRIRL
jgi:hypothetical protein